MDLKPSLSPIYRSEIEINEELKEKVRKYPCIYRNGANLGEKFRAWQEISTSMSLNVSTCKKLWKSLEANYDFTNSQEIDNQIDYKCSECGIIFDCPKTLEEHISFHHLNYLPYYCTLCPFDTAFCTEMHHHMHKIHAHPEQKAVFAFKYDTEKDRELRKMLKRSLEESFLKSEPTESKSQKDYPILSPEAPPKLESEDVQTRPEPFFGAINITDDLIKGGIDVEYDDDDDVEDDSSMPEIPTYSKPGPYRITPKQPNAENVVVCQVCETVLSKNYLSRHIIIKHLGEKMFRCPYCDHSSNEDVPSRIKKHVQKIHPHKEQTYISARNTHRKQIRDLSMQCFPENPVGVKRRKPNVTKFSEVFSSDWNHLKPENAMTCGLCDEVVSVNHLARHISWKHLNVMRHVCNVCDFSTNNRNSLRSHMMTQHPSNTEDYSNAEVTMVKEIRSILPLCFPDVPPENLKNFSYIRKKLGFCVQ